MLPEFSMFNSNTKGIVLKCSKFHKLVSFDQHQIFQPPCPPGASSSSSMPLPLARSLVVRCAGIHGNRPDAILRATPFAFYERPAEAVPESSWIDRQKMYHQKYQNPFWIYQKLIQKVENTTQALSFKRMISDKRHLRLSPQDFPIGSAFRCFSAFGPADSVTLLREAGWIARMGGSDCEGTLILLTVDVLLKPWRFNVFTSNSWLEPNRSFKESFVKESQKANNFSRAKKKNSDNPQLSQKWHCPCYHWEAPRFFPLLPWKPMPGFGTSIPAVTPSSCGPESSIGWRSKCPTG